MPRYFEGNLTAPKGRFAICCSRFNSFITDELLKGALDALARHGIPDGDIDVFRVPGAFDLPGLAHKVAAQGSYSGIICLGAVIRGGTPHFEHVASQAARGIGEVALSADCAVSFGVLTCDTVEQAIERAGTKAGNKGAEAAAACIELVNLHGKMSQGLGKGRLKAVDLKKK